MLSTVLYCDHHEAAVADSLACLPDRGLDLLLVIGASASVDRRDCVPRGIENAGGEVASLGLPLDPGHLTLLARCGDVSVLGCPRQCPLTPSRAQQLRYLLIELIRGGSAGRVR